MPAIEPELTAAQLADGRARFYTLLSRLAAGPIAADLQPYLAALAPLSSVLPTATPAQLAALYQTTLAHEVLPFAGHFLHPDGLVGGSLHPSPTAFYHAIGYTPNLHSGGPDHLASLLAALAHLCAAETDALHDARHTLARQIQHLQQQLLGAFLLPWLPPLTIALARSGNAFYAACGDLILTTCAEHWQSLSTPKTTLGPHITAALNALNASPAPPDLTTGGTREIAAFLCLPFHSGLDLLPRDLRALGSTLHIVPGFGGRARQLQTLFQTVPLTDLPTLLQELAALAHRWHTAYAAHLDIWPHLHPWISPWLARTTTTAAWLAQMQNQVNAL